MVYVAGVGVGVGAGVGVSVGVSVGVGLCVSPVVVLFPPPEPLPAELEQAAKMSDNAIRIKVNFFILKPPIRIKDKYANSSINIIALYLI